MRAFKLAVVFLLLICCAGGCANIRVSAKGDARTSVGAGSGF